MESSTKRMKPGVTLAYSRIKIQTASVMRENSKPLPRQGYEILSLKVTAMQEKLQETQYLVQQYITGKMAAVLRLGMLLCGVKTLP